MTEYVKLPHTAIFTGPTNCGKTKLLLDLIEKEYRHHFETIVILCPTLRWNKTYRERPWIWKDEYVFCIEPGDKLINYIESLSKLLAGESTLFILDDCISNKELDKTRGALLDLAISGRHREHYMFILTQRYTKIPLAVRDQLKQLFIWYPKNKDEFELIHRENHIIDSEIEIKKIKSQLKNAHHACLYLRIEYPRAFKVIS